MLLASKNSPKTTLLQNQAFEDEQFKSRSSYSWSELFIFNVKLLACCLSYEYRVKGDWYDERTIVIKYELLYALPIGIVAINIDRL